MKQLGLEVTVLLPEPEFPDSVFIEDAALCTSEGAVITRPGAPSREAESLLLVDLLNERFQEVKGIQAPGTLDAGDVLMVEDHFYIGLSTRTNQTGVDQLTRILTGWGLSSSHVAMNEMLHLKSGVSYLGDQQVLIAGELERAPAFAEHAKVVVPQAETYAANALSINGSVLVASGFPRTVENLRASGYQVIELDMSEFEKMDGGLSCLSLRY